MEERMREYYDNNAVRLHRMVDRILCKFGGIEQKDSDDFYSLANAVFTDVMKRYDEEQDFDGFLYSCLENRIKTEFTRRNRQKRKADRMSISLDAPIDEEGSLTVGDTIMSDFDIDKELGETLGTWMDGGIRRYLEKLSKKQRMIAIYLSDGYRDSEIKDILHITEKEYTDCMRAIRSYEYVKILMH